HAGARSGRLVHLSKYKCSLRVFQYFLVHLAQIPSTFFHAVLELFSVGDNVRFYHLAQQVITLSRTLSYTGEYGNPFIPLGNVVDQFLNQNCLTHTGTSKKPNLTALGVGLDEVNNLNPRV